MKPAALPKNWVEEKNQLLKEALPKHVQEAPFYPDAYFYVQYYQDHLKGLHFMAGVLFEWLKIEPQGCIVDFYDEKDFKDNLTGETAGFYTKTPDKSGIEREVIMINSKYKDNPLAVGAILAHEIMHLYLFRLNLKLVDQQENELLTDLATINTGFSILIVNGMYYSSQWWLTIILLAIGRIYWHTEQLAFGYFKPKEYGQYALAYFQERNIEVEDFIGYINPTSRHFISHGFFVNGKQSTEFIQILEKRYKRSNIIKGTVASVVVIVLFYFGSSENNKENALKAQIQTCQSEIPTLENKIESDQARLESMETQVADYEASNDMVSYNNLVDPHNALLNQIKEEVTTYKTKLTNCNNLVDQYNKL
jgi:outer membrane murein-binding lipoprotein Lpp